MTFHERQHQTDCSCPTRLARIAADIHDFVLQPLVALVMRAELAAASHTGTEPVEDFRLLAELAREAMRETQLVVKDERQAVDGSLGAALQQIGGWLESSFQVRAVAEVGPLGDLDAAPHEALCRAVREIAINACKHSGAGAVWITGRRSVDEIMVDVRDEGCGFAGSRGRAGNGAKQGLRILEERLYLVSGRIEIESARGGGTCVRVIVPARGARVHTGGLLKCVA